ncbi:MAG: AAA family ATPase [Pseudomonadales bacterium]|nr:AAA family ATPase [Pseudomonadales bacterium]
MDESHQPKVSLLGLGRRSIARKVLVYIVLCSSCVTLLVTAYQLYDDFKDQTRQVDASMVQIEHSYRESIGNAIWFLNVGQIKTILAGIMEFEDVHFVSIQIREGESFSLGQRRPSDTIRSFEEQLEYVTQGKEVDVGRLNIESNLDGVIERLGDKFGLILVSQAIKTFVVSLLILLILYYLVARHLNAISDFAGNLDLEDKETFLALDRAESTLDELDQIATAMNQMKQNLIEDSKFKQKAEDELRQLKTKIEMERDYLREEVQTIGSYGEIIGASPALLKTLSEVESVAKTGASVLVCGESGVGKEMIARAIHNNSDRAAKALVKVNCASIPNELFESEFFGHVRGSFTGAHQDRVGRLQLADGGTLFLDEVGEIPLAQQGKLLRALQEGEFERVGDDRTMAVDTRVVAASNRKLEVEVSAGRFREDLFYRLNVFPIEVPPLRERREDIVPLAQSFLDQVCRETGRELLNLTHSDVAALEGHDWPGNIRELKNIIERAVISSRGTKLELSIALNSVGATISPSTVSAESLAASFLTDAEFRELEKANIVSALKNAEWKTWGENGAAALLGIKPSTLAYQIKKHGITKP